MSEQARIMAWDGLPTGRCDHIGCANPLALHVEFTSPESEYGAESDLCTDHLAQVHEQARAFLIVLGRLAPISETERNVAAVAAEHIAPDGDR